MSAHTLLCELDKWRKNHDGKFPEELFIQVDGGSENANKTILGLCEYLVAKRLIKSITYTRLPTGHTHEDIDASFAHIWRGMRQRPIHTVDEYAAEISNIFNGSLLASVVDLYVIADFTKFFQNSIDPHFAAYAKEEDTQHQFKFDAIKPSTDFPFGCRVMYRAYASDKVIEFVKKPKEQCLSPIGRLTGLEPHTLLVTWGPKKPSTINHAQFVTGFYLLTEMPYLHNNQMFPPKEFEKNSMESFAKTIREAKNKFSDRPAICAAWEKWEKDKLGNPEWSAAEYATAKPLLYQVPLLKFFRLAPRDTCNPDWDTQLSTELVVTDSDFKFPEQLARAEHSVRSSWQRDPMPSRVFATMDTELRATLALYDDKAKVYYDSYLNSNYTKEKLMDILRERLSSDGDVLPLGGSKPSLIKRVKESDKAYLTVFYKSLTPENNYFLTTMLHRPYRRAEDGDEIKATSTDGSLTLTLSQIRQFNAEKSLRFEVMQFIMNLFNERIKLMMDTHSRRHGSDQNYIALKNNIFLMSSSDLAEIPTTILQNVYKVFICFKQTNDDDNDDWVALIVDFNRRAVYYIEPTLSGEVVTTAPLQHKLNRYEEYVNSWMRRCNWIPDTAFPCKLYPKEENSFETIQNNVDSGVYITAIIDMVSHDCPRYFAQCDTYTFRQNICYSILNNYLPY